MTPVHILAATVMMEAVRAAFIRTACLVSVCTGVFVGTILSVSFFIPALPLGISDDVSFILPKVWTILILLCVLAIHRNPVFRERRDIHGEDPVTGWLYLRESQSWMKDNDDNGRAKFSSIPANLFLHSFAFGVILHAALLFFLEKGLRKTLDIRNLNEWVRTLPSKHPELMAKIERRMLDKRHCSGKYVRRTRNEI